MKTLSVLFSLMLSFGMMNNSNNGFDYEKAWLEVEQLMNKALPKSAIQKVEEIIKAATQEKNDPELIKCIVYLSRLHMQTEENGLEASIKLLEDITNQHTAPVKNIAYIYLAELYQLYFEYNRYTISQRTNILGEAGPDFRTWSAQNFTEKISDFYFLALKDEKALQLPIDRFTPILNKYDSLSIRFRPNIYEVLVDRAISYFSSNLYNDTSDPTGSISGNKALFSEDSQFIKLELTDGLEYSNLAKAVKLYQNVIKLQLDSKANYALAEYDLARLKFVFEQSTHYDKDSLFTAALDKLILEHKNIDFTANIMFEKAIHIKNQSADSLSNVKALEICREAIKLWPDSEGGNKCRFLIDQILQPSLQMMTESVYPVGKALNVALDYNNIDEVSISVAKPDEAFLKKWKVTWDTDIRNQMIRSLTHLSKKTIELKSNGKYTIQRTQTTIDKQASGTYFIIVESKPTEKFSQEAINFALIQVSDLSYTTYTAEGKRYYLVTDRNSGKPIKNAEVAIYEQKYDQISRANYDKLLSKHTTDKYGKVQKEIIEQINFKAVITYKKDKLDLSHFTNDYKERTQPETRFIEIFTDRSIYRPGQTVYFKALLLKKDAHNIPSIISKKNITAKLLDANRQEISKITSVTNEFGSFSGNFIIPTGRLTGGYSIECSSDQGGNGAKYFQVEEYKRPRFEVVMEDLTQAYKLNQQITVSGKAQSLAGSNVDGAKVNYKVVRSPRFRPWEWYRPIYQSPETLISSGQTITKQDGSFNIDFIALPDLKEDINRNPFFHFTVEVNITDQTGETISTSTMITCGYAAFSLSADLSGTKDVTEISVLNVKATNGQGNMVKAAGNVRIFKLKEPNKTPVRPYWQESLPSGTQTFSGRRGQSNIQYMTDQADVTGWVVDKKVLDTRFDTDNPVPLNKILGAGVYKIELKAFDSDGIEVSHIQYLILTDFGKKIFPKTSFVFSKLNKTSFEPGEVLQLELGTSDKPIYTHVIIEKDGRILLEKALELCNYEKITLPVTEAYRGGISVHIRYNKHNRSFSKNVSINIPWTNKELKIEFETFRDKLLPGQQETYRIKIKGSKSDGVAAEMLASMYDASLDKFVSHTWNTKFYAESYPRIRFDQPGYGIQYGQFLGYPWDVHYGYGKTLIYPALINIGDFMGRMYNSKVVQRSMSSMENQVTSEKAAGEGSMDLGVETPTQIAEIPDESIKKEQELTSQIRKNLDETVFFYPQLTTDSEGNVILNFTMKEALTRWKLMSFAHTKDLQVGYDERTLQTRKDLMVFPNAPRFFREGDTLLFSGKVSNLTDQKIDVVAELQFFDALTMHDITNVIIKDERQLKLSVTSSGSMGLVWKCIIPEALTQAITYRISVRTDTHTDIEENTVPVVTNRMLVTETMPLHLKGKEQKTFTFKAFSENQSKTKKDFNYTFEYTSSPVWYAIQALPYILEHPFESTDQIVNRFYANQLASTISKTHPKIQAVFNQWKSTDSEALKSNLLKNQELKAALLEETPWVLQALSESEQKRNIALLFDLNKMQNEAASDIKKLAERQSINGGFSWFQGGRDSEYTTQYILENLGYLKKLGALNPEQDMSEIMLKALKYTDLRTKERYERLKEHIKKHGGSLESNHLDQLSIHYLYTRSFFKSSDIEPSAQEAYNYYLGQAKRYWLSHTIYVQAMIGLILHRSENPEVKDILKSLRERSFTNPELGMYWNEGNGFYWYQLPIERHAMLIELFAEADKKESELDNMKIWLLKNKQTNHWKTSKATASAIYALLLQGEKTGISTWVTENNLPDIQIGKEKIQIAPDNVEAGSGYIKQSWKGSDIQKDMATIQIKNNNQSIAWGAAYYQYFENLDQIKTFEDTPLKLKKQLFKKIITTTGDKLEEINNQTQLAPGDKLVVRIELRVDRAMEYIHMKDMRASGLEPVNVISGYKYQGQLGYYESTRDMATHFFIDYLPKGTFVFEYPLIVVHEGTFSGGITSIQSMYAPEFSSHSEGTRLKIGK